MSCTGSDIDDSRRAERIWSALACPSCGHCLDQNGPFYCAHCGIPYSFIGDALVFADNPSAYMARLSSGHTNPYTKKAVALIEDDSDAWILDFGAGNPSPDQRYANVLRLDAVHLPASDVVSTYERLPFKEASFDAVVSESVFEHLRDPTGIAAELWRILKPGGRLLVDTAFMQPYHADPDHYFNMTIAGLRVVFSRFTEVAAGFGSHQTPGTTLNLLVRTFAGLISASELRQSLLERFALDFREFDAHIDLSQGHIMAAGVWFAGIKGERDGLMAHEQEMTRFRDLLTANDAGVTIPKPRA